MTGTSCWLSRSSAGPSGVDERCVDQSEAEPLLMLAMRLRDSDVLRQLLEHSHTLQTEDSRGGLLLHAAWSGDFDCLTEVLCHCPHLDINTRQGIFGWTTLHAAVEGVNILRYSNSRGK